MTTAQEYRANAETCRRMADVAPNERDKRAWLEMAQTWSFLIKLEDETGDEVYFVEGERGRFSDLFKYLKSRGLDFVKIQGSCTSIVTAIIAALTTQAKSYTPRRFQRH